MADCPSLADVLGRNLEEKRYTAERLARESGVSKKTLHHWLRGHTTKPQTWQPLLQVAAALGLSRPQVDELLRAAQHPPVGELLERAGNGEDGALLSRWTISAPGNLPGQLTGFVGRGEETARVGRLLSEARLVTLTGSGGCGKTRLALQVAETLAHTFRDGAFFVPLASVGDPDLLLPAVAQILRVRQVAGEPLEDALEEHLRKRQMLLVLDNLEQLVAAAPRIVGQLRAAPALRVLATSRVTLHATGEHEFPLAPLPLPDPDADLAALAANPAVALFADRARAVNPDWQLTPDNTAAVAKICGRVDGLPLAIELAAARSKHFNPQDLLERFPSRLDLGGDGPRDAPERHRSLRAVIAWSYGLLGPGERALFERLAVFAGGWSEEAAETICNAEVGPQLDIGSALRSLLDSSLIRRAPGVGGEPRYGMLETIREYAAERLAASGRAEETRQRHATNYLALGESTGPLLYGPQKGVGIARLERERDNLRVALGWLLESGNGEAALRLAAALSEFWHERDYLDEGLRWLDRALSLGGDAGASVCAPALYGAALLALKRRDYARAQVMWGEALAQYERLGNETGVADTIGCLGLIAQDKHDYPGARVLYRRSLEMHRRLGNMRGIALTLGRLGWMEVSEGHFDRANELCEESLPLLEELGDTSQIASACLMQAFVAFSEGDPDRVDELLERSLRLCRESEYAWGISVALMNQGYAALMRDDHGRAEGLFRESLQIMRRLRDRYYIAYCLDGLAAATGALGHPLRAAHLAGAAEALRDEIGVPVSAHERPLRELIVAAIRAQTDDATWDAAWAEGRGVPLEQAIASGLDSEAVSPGEDVAGVQSGYAPSHSFGTA